MAAVENRYGKGTAIVFGSLLGYGANDYPQNARLLVALAVCAGVKGGRYAGLAVPGMSAHCGGQGKTREICQGKTREIPVDSPGLLWYTTRNR